MKKLFLPEPSFIKKFHENERGDDTIKNVMLLVVGALVVIMLIAFGKKVYQFLEGKWQEITQS